VIARASGQPPRPEPPTAVPTPAVLVPAQLRVPFAAGLQASRVPHLRHWSSDPGRYIQSMELPTWTAVLIKLVKKRHSMPGKLTHWLPEHGKDR
jgi:hypothetical protein